MKQKIKETKIKIEGLYDFKTLIKDIAAQEKALKEEEIESKNRVDISLSEYERLKSRIKFLEDEVDSMNKIINEITKGLNEELLREVVTGNFKCRTIVYDNPATLNTDITILYSIPKKEW